MTEGFVKIKKWLLPFSWLYGMGVSVRNKLFDFNILKSKVYDVPVIAVGNISVGGAGKTPHVEYLIKLLEKDSKVAVLSRGYKRKTKGYILANEKSTVKEIGDEPLQMKRKFPNIFVAVDEDRCDGIDRLITDKATKETDVILLDDAFQHRYVKPGINILLVDFNRQLIHDKLLPAGNLRESKEGKNRADIVIITKCPKTLKPMEIRVLTKAMNLYPYQTLLFTTIEYDKLKPIYCGEKRSLEAIGKDEHVLLLAGIASPQHLINYLKTYTKNVTSLKFRDHHQFTTKDLQKINQKFEALPSPKMIITTEKDAVRLLGMEGLSDEVRQHIYVLPINVKFLLEQEEIFNHKIISYVHKNSRHSILVKAKDDNKSKDSNHSGNGTRTISFRNY